MPTSIDPITNLTQTFVGMCGRVLLCMLCAWVANNLGYFCREFIYWDDFYSILDPDDWSSLLEFDFQNELHEFIFWPVVFWSFFEGGAALGFTTLLATLIILLIIIRTDSPILFWATLLITVIFAGHVFCARSWPTLVASIPVWIVLGAGLWYTVLLNHSEWVEWLREKIASE